MDEIFLPGIISTNKKKKEKKKVSYFNENTWKKDAWNLI